MRRRAAVDKVLCRFFWGVRGVALCVCSEGKKGGPACCLLYIYARPDRRLRRPCTPHGTDRERDAAGEGGGGQLVTRVLHRPVCKQGREGGREKSFKKGLSIQPTKGRSDRTEIEQHRQAASGIACSAHRLMSRRLPPEDHSSRTRHAET